MPFQNDILGGASGSQGVAYTIDQSLYMGDAPNSGPKLSRTLTSAGSVNPKWTYSTWFKKGTATTAVKCLFWVNVKTPSAGSFLELSFDNDKPEEQAGLRWYGTGPTNPIFWHTGHTFYDFGAWMHVCQVIDYSNATTPCQFYFNGILAPNTADFWDVSFVGGATGGWATDFSPVSGDVFNVGCNNSTQMLSGYMADTYWIEGQALNPVGTFGEFNEDTGQFVPIKYTGTYAGNSFYLNYSDSADFGADSSGLGNDFTVTSIAATKQVLDTPTNNFCTLNPLDLGDNGSWNGALVEGNLSMSGSSGLGKSRSTFALDNTNGSYWEVRWGSATDNNAGISKLTQKNLNTSSKIGADPAYDETGYKGSTGVIDTDGSTEATYATSASGDILGFAYKAGRLYVGKIASAGSEATWFNSGAPASGTGYVNASVKTDPTYWAAALNNNHSINFGQDSSFAGEETAQGNTDANDVGDFWGTVPTGYLALCSNNLPDPAIALPGENFNTLIYTSNDSTLSVTGLGFQPDFCWFKVRNIVGRSALFDSVRGVYKVISSNGNYAELTIADMLTSFDSDGWTIGVDAGQYGVNYDNTSTNFVSWNWKGDGVAGGTLNEDGDTDSYVNVNTAAGFSIVKVTFPDSLDHTFGHGLAKAPELVIGKDVEAAARWWVYAEPIGNTKYLSLNETWEAKNDYEIWQDTTPSASVVYVTGGTYVTDEEFINYCFHSVEDYSKIGSYTGNGNADGPFIYTGFRPAYFLLKNTSRATNWQVYDAVRNTYNVLGEELYPDENSAGWSGTQMDFVSNGVKIRYGSTAFNYNGDTIIYMAFAENPFKTSRAR